VAQWTWAAASRRGTAHAAAGDRRQDAHRVLAVGRWLIAVACDGAGTASRGGAGAAVVARTLSACAATWVEGGAGLPCDATVVGWLMLARLRIEQAAGKRGLLPRDFATTMVMTMGDGSAMLTAHVGDGAALARCAETGAWLSLSWPEAGEYAAETFFATDESVRLRISRHDGEVDRLALMTDGLERLALDFALGVPHAPFLDAVTAPVADALAQGRDHRLSRQLGAYLGSPPVNARTDDDKTAILAVRV